MNLIHLRRHKVVLIIPLFIALIVSLFFIHVSEESFKVLSNLENFAMKFGKTKHTVRKKMGVSPTVSGLRKEIVTKARMNNSIPWDFSGPKFPSRIIFNRVGKCGSRTVLEVIQKLSQQNHFNVYSSTIYNKTRINLQEKINLAKDLHKMESPFIFQRHLHYVDFTQFDSINLAYINIIRDPLSRMISHYYYRRFGDARMNEKQIGTTFKGSEEEKQRGFDECVLKHHQECSEKGSFYIIPFFCGHHQNCRQPSQWALDKAKENVVDKFIFVGILEKLEESFVLLEKILPDFFSGANSTYHKLVTSEFASHTATISKRVPTPAVQNIMKERLKLEYEFYNYIVNLLERTKKKY